MYDPKAFDEIRENYGLEREDKKSRLYTRIAKGIVLFAWGFLLSFAIGATIALHYASALETLPTNQTTKEKTGFDTLTLSPGSGAYTQGRFFDASRTEGLTIYMDYGINSYNTQTFITVNNNHTSGGVSWWFNNGQDGEFGRNCGGNCNSGHEALIRGAVNITPLLGDWLDLEILVQTKNAPGDAIIDHRWRVLSKKDGTVAWLVPVGDYYTARNGSIYWVSHSGSDFVYRRMNATQNGWDDTGTLGFPINYQYPATAPRCVETSAYTGVNEPVCFYRGADNAPYAVFLFGSSVTALWRMDTGEMTGGGWQNYICHWLPGCEGSAQPAIEALSNMRPFGLIEPNTDNVAILWDKYQNEPEFGAITTANITVSGFYSNEIGFVGLSGFINPKMYFTRIDGTTAIHDLSCVQPGFENCGAYNGGFACQSANGAVPIAPMPIIACNAPLEVPPYYYDPNYSGSGTTGGTGTTGGNCSGSGCINQGTGSGAISGMQQFIDYVTDCDTDDNGEVTIGEGLLCIPGSIGRFFGGIFDRLASVWDKTWALIEATMKMATPTGSGMTSPFSFDFIETAHAETGEVNPMVQALAGQVDSIKDNTNPLGKFVDYLYWGIIFVMFIAGILIFAKARK